MEPTVAKFEGAAEPAVAVGRSATKVKRILQSAGLGLVVQHWIALETRAIPSLFILIAQAFPSLAFLVSFLSDRIRFYWLLIVFLVVYLLWRTRKHQLEPKQKATLRRILSYLKPHWPYVAALSTAIVAAAALDLAQPWIIAILLVGEVLLKSNLGFLPLVVGLLVGTFVVKEYFRVVPAAWQPRFPIAAAGALLEVGCSIFRRHEPGWREQLRRVVGYGEEVLSEGGL